MSIGKLVKDSVDTPFSTIVGIVAVDVLLTLYVSIVFTVNVPVPVVGAKLVVADTARLVVFVHVAVKLISILEFILALLVRLFHVVQYKLFGSVVGLFSPHQLLSKLTVLVAWISVPVFVALLSSIRFQLTVLVCVLVEYIAPPLVAVLLNILDPFMFRIPFSL